VNFCSGVILKEVTHEHDDGRRHQEMDRQTKSSVGDENYSRKSTVTEAI
jgi:hypothetical protein